MLERIRPVKVEDDRDAPQGVRAGSPRNISRAT